MNIIRADFKNKYTAIVVGHRYQWDYGQVLMFEGLDLPPVFSVDFSNREDMGEAVTAVGTPTDGVPIPDELFETGKSVYAFVFLHNTEDDGRTRYKVKIPVRKRPKPIDIEVDTDRQSTLDQALAIFQAAASSLDDSAERAEEAVHTYPKIVDGYWYVWDIDAQEYVDTGVAATGEASEADLREDFDKVTEPDVNLLYYYDWVTDGADIEFVGNNIILTATDSTKPAIAYVDIPSNRILISYDSKTSQSENSTAASIRVGHVNSSGNVTWNQYVTSSPSASVFTDNIVRVQLYVDQVAVAEGTTATFTKLQAEKQGAGRPIPTEFSNKTLTAIDYVSRRKIASLINEINELKERVAALEES